MADKKITFKKVHIIDNYYCTVDNLFNHTLYYIEEREVQKLGWKAGGTGKYKQFKETVGYYPDMGSLLKALATDATCREVDNCNITTIKEYLDYYNQITERLSHIKI